MMIRAPDEDARETPCPSTVVAEPGNRVWEPIRKFEEASSEKVSPPIIIGATDEVTCPVGAVVVSIVLLVGV